MSGWFNVLRKDNTYRAPEQPRAKVIRPTEMPPQQMPGYPQDDQNVPPVVARPAPVPGGPAGGGQLAAPAMRNESAEYLRLRAEAKDLLRQNRTEEACVVIRDLVSILRRREGIERRSHGMPDDRIMAIKTVLESQEDQRV